jgi:hypothetical protein
MSRSSNKILTVIGSAAALIMISTGDLSPAGVRTAFELLGSGSKGRTLVADVMMSE